MRRFDINPSLKKIFLTISILLVLLFSAVLGGFWWAYKNPDQVYAFIQKRYFPPDLKITWEKINFKLQYQNDFSFLLLLDLDNVLIEKETPQVNAPIDKVYVNATLLLRQKGRWSPFLDIHVLRLESEKNILFQIVTPPDPQAEEKSPLQTLDSLIQLSKNVFTYARFSEVNINLTNVTYKSFDGLTLQNKLALNQPANIDNEPAQPVSASAQQGSNASISDELQISIESKSIANSVHDTAKTQPPFRLLADAQARLDQLNTTEPFLKGKIEFDGFNTKLDTSFFATYHKKNNEPQFILKTKDKVFYTLKPENKPENKSAQHIKVDSDSHFLLTNKLLDSQLTMTIENIPGEISRFNNVDIKLQVPLDEKETFADKKSNFSVRAPIELLFIKDRLKKSLQSSCQCKLPLKLLLQLDGDMNLYQILQEPPAQVQVLHAKAELETLENDVFMLDAKANISITKEKKNYYFDPYIDLKAHVTSFRKLAPLLDAYGIMVPSPFDILDGRMDLVAKGPVEISSLRDQKNTIYTFPIDLKAHLQSTKQILNVETVSKVAINSDFSEAVIDTKIKIHDLQLELPPLDPAGGKPRITRDKRIIRDADIDKYLKKEDRLKSGVQNPDSKFKFIVNYELKTTKNAAIRLLYKMFEPYLGLNVQIKSTNLVENSGAIEIVPFDVVYFRRRVHLEHMKLGLRSDENGFNVDGRLSVQQTMYTIYIDILGTAAKPVVQLSSSPYLERSDIISVLLYDRTQDQLISADAETAGSVQAAIADRAIGLLGLWAFAATPIRSFYYNPISKVYTATVDLGDGVSAGIGSDWESSTQLELRKRVSRQWVLTGKWISPSLDKKEKTELVLQWERRF